MVKKKNPQRLLSPEDYIRQRARGIPLFKCLITTDWKKNGVASILISRIHANGNITLCFYYVDLFCMGIKNTFFRFNNTLLEYEEVMARANRDMALEEVDYSLAHNILHAGWEYAEELGFKPHKDFLSVTRYMLEEDTDAIPLIEIECGLHGKPCYVQGVADDAVTVRKTIDYLTKKVGTGNFDYIISCDSGAPYSYGDDGWDDDDSIYEEMEE